MEAYLRCSALGLNSEVAALSSSPSHANDVDILFGTGKELASGSLWTFALSCDHFQLETLATLNVHNHQRNFLKPQKEYLFRSYLKVSIS